jgi:predicted enzyme related to lactoylglutathione lyase
MSLLALSWAHRYSPGTCHAEDLLFQRVSKADMANSHGCFLWYQLLTTDVEAAKAFYAEVVGWGMRDASAPGMPYTLFTAGHASVAGLMALSEDATQTGARPSWLGYVGVDDVDATADRIRRLGGLVHVPPMDIPDVSRFSIVADPQMATVGLFKGMKAREEQVADPRARGRVGWHELLAADWKQAWAFYGELFGWQKAEFNVGAMGEYQQFSAGGQTIGGMMNKPPMVIDPCWLYYFNIGDIDAAVKRLKAGGGQVLRGPTEVLDGNWIVQCGDPQGAMFALIGQRGLGYFERVDRVGKRSKIASR